MLRGRVVLPSACKAGDAETDLWGPPKGECWANSPGTDWESRAVRSKQEKNSDRATGGNTADAAWGLLERMAAFDETAF